MTKKHHVAEVRPVFVNAIQAARALAVELIDGLDGRNAADVRRLCELYEACIPDTAKPTRAEADDQNDNLSD